jgi:hypothetical protein
MSTTSSGPGTDGNVKPTQAPANAPAYSWPSPPMLKNPARKLTITADDSTRSGISCATRPPKPCGVCQLEKNNSL